ncbi:MAG: hypothetical protein H6713_24345 [Myxococcales bacterium]|nr:hypothetical protein [Myxococcales bacterium]
MDVVVYVLGALCLLKAVWNVAVPYALLRMEEGRGVSLSLALEWLLAAAASVGAAVNSSESLAGDAATVGAALVGAILLSYLHMLVVPMIVGAIRTRRGDDRV